MALIDACFLLDLLPGMIHTAFISDLYRNVHLICYIQTYISFVASFIHIWMVLVFTAERFFAVNFPLKHILRCTPNLSRIIILIIIIPAFISYIHPAFFVSAVDNKGQCREKDGYERYLHNLNIIDTIMTMFLPFILVLILNILIIRKLFCSKTFRQHILDNGSRYHCRRTSIWKQKPIQHMSPSSLLLPLSTLSQSDPILLDQSKHMIRPFRLIIIRGTSYFYRTFRNSESLKTHNNSMDEKQQRIESKLSLNKTKQITSSKRHESAQKHVLTELRLTKMLLAISLICLSLNFPSYYLRFIFLYKNSKEHSSTNSNEINLIFYCGIIFHCMSYLSYSINIIIYLLFGGNFRRALKHLFSLTPIQSSNFNINLRRNKLFNHHDQRGNTVAYDSSIVVTSGSPCSRSKSFKSQKQFSLDRPLH